MDRPPVRQLRRHYVARAIARLSGRGALSVAVPAACSQSWTSRIRACRTRSISTMLSVFSYSACSSRPTYAIDSDGASGSSDPAEAQTFVYQSATRAISERCLIWATREADLNPLYASVIRNSAYWASASNASSTSSVGGGVTRGSTMGMFSVPATAGFAMRGAAGPPEPLRGCTKLPGPRCAHCDDKAPRPCRRRGAGFAARCTFGIRLRYCRRSRGARAPPEPAYRSPSRLASSAVRVSQKKDHLAEAGWSLGQFAAGYTRAGLPE